MSSDFFYFISSLPMLRLSGEGAPELPAYFDSAESRLSSSEAAILRRLRLSPSAEMVESDLEVPVIRKWYQWQVAMRNAMAERRGRRLHLEPSRFMRPQEDAFPGDLKQLEAAMDMPTAAARQEAWEELQWDFLENLAGGCYFDFQAAVVYTLKLLLINSRQRSREVGNARFEEMMSGLLKQATEKRRLVE